MRRSRIAIALALTVAAVLLALFARDLLATQRAMVRDDLRVESGLAARPTWRASTVLPYGWAEGLLGLRGDRDLRLAIELFAETYARPAGFDGGQAEVRQRDAAEAALAASAADADPQRASQALDLLGLLVFGDSTAGAGAAAATRAVSDLTQAVALDDANDDAKANLELVLRGLRAEGSRIGSAAAAGPRSTGRRGAGSGLPGEGY